MQVEPAQEEAPSPVWSSTSRKSAQPITSLNLKGLQDPLPSQVAAILPAVGWAEMPQLSKQPWETAERAEGDHVINSSLLVAFGRQGTHSDIQPHLLFPQIQIKSKIRGIQLKENSNLSLNLLENLMMWPRISYKINRN